MENSPSSLWLRWSSEQTSKLPAPNDIRATWLQMTKLTYCCFHPQTTEWNISLWQRGLTCFFSWTRGLERWPQGEALTRWRGTALPGVLLSLPGVTKLSLNSEHNHFDSSAPMEPTLENWPTIGQDSALGMDEACSFRSCERIKTNATVTPNTWTEMLWQLRTRFSALGMPRSQGKAENISDQVHTHG